MQSGNTEICDTVFNLEYAHSVPALSKAVRQGDLKTIKKLLLNGSLPQTPDNRGWTPIHHCAASSKFAALKLILRHKHKQKKYLVNLQTWENETPLSLALKAQTPSLKIVKLLLKSGASPNLNSFTNLSPLHIACKKRGNLEFVKLLVEHGADVNLQDDLNKYTPLHFAICEAKDLDVTKYLLEICDLSLEDSYSLNAFAQACNYGFVEAVKLFLAKDKNLVKATTPVPPIVHALVWGNLEVTKLLVENGADLNTKCKAYLNCGNDSEIIVLDLDNYLPIHSSISNLEVFKFILPLTKAEEILKTNTNYCTFPLFLLVYSPNICFFEELLKSDVINELKIISSRVIVNFLIGSPEKSETVLEKFHLFFKYNFYLEPDDVFQNFVCMMSEDELKRNKKFIYILAKMGISSDDQLSNKISVIECFKNVVDEICEESCRLLAQSVLNLKQLSRIVLRRWVRHKAENDWTALKMIQESNIPNDIKQFICFES